MMAAKRCFLFISLVFILKYACSRHICPLEFCIVFELKKKQQKFSTGKCDSLTRMLQINTLFISHIVVMGCVTHRKTTLHQTKLSKTEIVQGKIINNSNKLQMKVVKTVCNLHGCLCYERFQIRNLLVENTNVLSAVRGLDTRINKQEREVRS